MARQRPGFARGVSEHGLRHLLRAMRIAVHLAQRGMINQADMAADKFREACCEPWLA
jgi:hypothetical protein